MLPWEQEPCFWRVRNLSLRCDQYAKMICNIKIDVLARYHRRAATVLPDH
jgi:hypothetical protein